MTQENEGSQKIRLNRYLSLCGLGSRRECEKYVLRGKIKINGATVKDLATRVDVERDRVHLGEMKLSPKPGHLYLIFNKPPGVTVSRKGFGEKTIFDFVRGMPANLTYAGRLDRDSEGLLFLTTDGEFIHRSTHPRFGFRKIYQVELNGPLSKQALDRFRQGVTLEDGPTLPAQIDSVGETPPVYRIILKEGRNRQIRRMMESLGRAVLRLKRVGFGPLRLEGLKRGEYRALNPRELQNLKFKLKLKPNSSGSDKEIPAPFRYSGSGHP